VIERAMIHVSGPEGSGKTSFIEAVLRDVDAWTLAARCVRDGSPMAERARENPSVKENLREIMLGAIARMREAPPTAPIEHWSIAPSHRGIEHAQLVVVNVLDEKERARGERLVADLLRLRKDDQLFADILGTRGTRIPITAVVANVTDPKDKGLRKAVARVKRTIARVAA
jgi:hypothetical protein